MDSYTKDNIKSLSIVEHIRHRPGMYIPSKGIDGIHHLLYEVLDNAIDEHLNGHTNNIEIEIEKSRATVIDYGRGIPVGYSNTLGMDSLTAVFTKPFTGGKFTEGTYHTSAGTFGVGSKAVCALTKTLDVSVYKDGSIYTQSFSQGIPISAVIKTSNSSAITSGTKVSFVPDPTIFEVFDFSNDIVLSKVNDLIGLCPGLTIKFNNKDYLTDKKLDYILDNLISHETLISNRFNYYTPSLRVSFQLVKSNYSYIKSFVNTVYTDDNGSHVDAILDSMCASIRTITKRALNRKQLQDGLGLVISCYAQDPVYKGQAKSKLSDKKIYNSVCNDIASSIKKYFDDNEEVVKFILDKIDKLQEAVDEAEIALVTKTIKKNVKDSILPSKLSIAYNADPTKRELIICEGDSAAGSIRTSRNPQFQEILPVKGKIINVLKTDLKSALNSKEIIDIFLSIGGMESNSSSLRTHNVFLMSDSDTDGSHINSLILGVFVLLFPSFIKDHNLYIMKAPLFTLESSDIRMHGSDRKKLIEDYKKKSKGSYKIYRNKGLGSMSPDEMVPHIAPNTRNIVKVEYNDQTRAEMEKILGDVVDLRRSILNDMEVEDEQ